MITTIGTLRWVVAMTRVVTASEVLDGHVALDIECLDRIYLNAYVPILQSSGQVVAFMTQHLGLPIPSPALFDKIGQKFRRSVASFAEANGIPWVRFAKEDRKAEVMAPYLKRAAATGRPQVAAIGVAQEFQRVWAAYRRDTRTAAPQFTFAKADRRVTCYYSYLWDADFGPAFIKVCAYFPYPAKIWVNGHEWAKRQAGRAGLSFTELSNGFAACDDPVALQEICDRLQPGTIEVFAQRWLHRLPLPFGPADQRAGYWWEISMRQVEISRTLVFDAPRRARAFFEALIADNLDIGRPANVEIIFNRHIRRDTPGVFRTAIDRPTVGPDSGGVVLNLFYKHSRIKQYLKDGRAMRIETVINAPRDLGCNARLPNLDELQAKARAANHRILETERAGQGTVLASPALSVRLRPSQDRTLIVLWGRGDWLSSCFLIAAGYAGRAARGQGGAPRGRTTLTPGRPAPIVARRGSGSGCGQVIGMHPRVGQLADGAALGGSRRAGRPALSRCAERSAWLRRHDA